MRKNQNIIFSILGESIHVRFTRQTYRALQDELAKDKRQEQFAFGLFNQTRTAEGSILIVQDIFVPDKKDLSVQSCGRVVPTHDFQATVYLIAEQRKQSILDIHTHTCQNAPRFSPIDFTESEKNAKYICRRFTYPTTHAMVVFNNDITAYDALVFDRSLDSYRSIDCVEILGRRIALKKNYEVNMYHCQTDSRYNRQMIIPGWDQATLNQLKVAVVGLGGNGSRVVETLVSIGVGTEGWIAGIDPDIIEESNIPRIPYAFPEHVGHPKATVAAEYARHKNPKVKFYPYPCSISEPVAIERLKSATVIICAPDNDGARKVCNELSIRYMIPMIDLGCDIQVEGEKVSAGGQVRLILPGDNACLVCCRGYDPSAAAVDLMDDERAAQHMAQGYVLGHQENPTPSVANLNAVIAQLGISTLLALVHGEKFGNWDYIHYDQLTAQTLTASTNPLDSCPLCSREGIFGNGGKKNKIELAQEPQWSLMNK